MYRRDFLVRTGHLVGAAALASALREAHAFAPAQLEPTSMSWEEFRASFNLAPDLIHMSGFFLASHPKPVRDAIEEHRRRFDENPIEYFLWKRSEGRSRCRRRSGTLPCCRSW